MTFDDPSAEELADNDIINNRKQIQHKPNCMTWQSIPGDIWDCDCDARTPEFYANKLYEDLTFAAPEVFKLHILRRFEEAYEEWSNT